MSAEEIAERVAVWIEAGRFRPGDHLKELDIAKKCNSSRAPVREAMRILQFQGFISLTRASSIRLTQASPKLGFCAAPTPGSLGARLPRPPIFLRKNRRCSRTR
jgi:DNA-binding FadR family transcriptional regulator